MVSETLTVSDYGMDGEMNVGNDSQMVCSADITNRVCRLVQITNFRR